MKINEILKIAVASDCALRPFQPSDLPDAAKEGIQAGGPGSGRKPSDAYNGAKERAQESSNVANNFSQSKFSRESRGEHVSSTENHEAGVHHSDAAMSHRAAMMQAAKDGNVDGVKEHAAKAAFHDKEANHQFKTAAGSAGLQAGGPGSGRKPSGYSKEAEAASEQADNDSKVANVATLKNPNAKEVSEAHNAAASAHVNASNLHYAAAQANSGDAEKQAYHTGKAIVHKANAEWSGKQAGMFDGKAGKVTASNAANPALLQASSAVQQLKSELCSIMELKAATNALHALREQGKDSFVDVG